MGQGAVGWALGVILCWSPGARSFDFWIDAEVVRACPFHTALPIGHLGEDILLTPSLRSIETGARGPAAFNGRRFEFRSSLPPTR